MRPALLLLSLFLSSCGDLLAQNNETALPKLSISTRRYLAALENEANGDGTPQGWVYKQTTKGLCVSGMIQVRNAEQAATALEQQGVAVGTKAGNIWTVQVPVGKMSTFLRTPGVSFIELDEPLAFPKLDQARKTTKTDSAYSGIGLPMPYTGKGVLVGVMDFGFDYNHPLFYDTTGTKYRLRRVWEMGSTGTPPSGYVYGRETSDTNVLKTMTTDNAKQTHGTSVAGMAMGSGYGSTSNTKWRGMAPEAEAVLVGVRRDSIRNQWMTGGFTDFLDGMGYMFNYAASVNKPIVVNVSWGSHSGPHDGTTLFNQATDAMTGPGKILVMSAGNDGRERIHMGKNFTATDSVLTTNITFDSSGFLPKRVRRTWVDAWGEAGKTWCADATLYRNGAAVSGTTSVCLDNGLYQRYLIGTGGDTCSIEFTNSLAEANGKPRQIVNINNRTTDTLRLRFRSTSGTVNFWNEYYYYGYDYGYQSAFSALGVPGAREGDTMMTVSDMGAGNSVLLVGAYVTRASWTDITGQNWNYNASYAPLNKLASFSSIGPMADGRIKPDITAPGLTVATALSSYDLDYTPTGASKIFVRAGYTMPSTGRTYYYGEFSGTSAAAPAASGIVALLLQAKPTLTPADVKSLLFQSAIVDTHTGALPASGTNTWGHGKINAYGALKLLAQQMGVSTTNSKTGTLDCTLFPNPGAGVLTLHHTGLNAEELTVNVYTSTGQLAVRRGWSVAPGTSVLEIDTKDLASGVYLVQVAGKLGSTTIRTVVSH